MNLAPTLRANNPAKHQQNLAMLNCGPWNMNAGGFFDLFFGVFAPTDNFRVIERNAQTSHGVVVWNNDEVLVIMGGTIGLQNAQGMVDGWVRGYTYSGDATQPRTFGDAWADVERQWPEFRTVPFTKITFIGYSFGGGVVMAGSAATRGLHRVISQEVFTYGAPRVSYPEGFPNWDSIPVVRVFLADDPVVNLPPHTTEIPLLTGVVGMSWAGNMNRVWHPVGGLRLNTDGTFDAMEDSTATGIYQFGAIADWFCGTNMFGNPQHAISRYLQVINQAAAIVPPQIQVIPPAHGDRVPVPPGPALRALVGRALETAGRRTRGQLDIDAIEILDRTTIIPGVKFRHRSIFGARVISYDKETVASTPQRRYQRQILRRLNSMVPK
jgi:hypothetical protein